MLHVFVLRWKLIIALALPVLCFIVHKARSPVTSDASMSPPSSPASVASSLLASKGLQLQSIKTIQSLWAGYGHICHLIASPNVSPSSSTQTSPSASTSNSNASTPQESQSFILKLITPPIIKGQDEGHARKILSYQVEQYFYSELAPLLPPSIPVATCFASVNEHHPNGTSTTAMILSDLRPQYPVAGERRESLSKGQVFAALDWLSGFHGFWWPRLRDMDRSLLVRAPLDEIQQENYSEKKKKNTVWLNGGYTYLGTRRKEYRSLASDYDSEWNTPLTEWEDGDNSISEMVANVLAPRESGWGPTEQYQTLIHGDVKSENLFTTVSGDRVAFYDFQYVGLGLGVCDLAKLFTCSVPLEMLVEDSVIPSELAMQSGEKALLERYWIRLKEVSGKEYNWDIFVLHWETALIDWLRFQASWGFWGNTAWLEARGRHVLKNESWKENVVRNWAYSQGGTKS
ncbi:hypothetical protein K504DRAFT_462513 [Pleomassaria siparia CBS 279.74]|uniref:Aminoglycoside phosphotransferase domain-containing protein n=1 Tax=Pleomassaria siparia CBS 279.74 TaxID=1314801 RepID=A0A6G1KMJ4_9PLEO|nr:hypothetical protein K504DRAFT_462513 [Pleomassaria siparia CBS 279.74]